MSNINIGALGTATFTVAAGASVVVFSRGTAQVYQVVGTPNHPGTLNLIGNVTNTQTVFGPFASGATLQIEASSTGAAYDVGVAPFIGTVSGSFQGTPGVLNATGALTAAMMTAMIITSTTAAAVAGTVPTGTVMDAASNLQVGDSFEFIVINTGATNTFTVTAAAAHTLVGNAVVALSASGHFKTVKTAAATYVTYRIA